jgi:hypothetical protein
MSPFRRVLMNALVLTLAVAPLGTIPALAQFYDPALQSLDLQSDVSRSPRLRGMGGLAMVVPDRNNHLTLWDFAANPLGAFAEDSTGTLDLRPSTGSGSGTHNRPPGLGERQDFAGRVSEIEFESFYRDHKSAAYGAVGQFASLRTDTPYNDDIEMRRSISTPEVMGIMNARFPRFFHDKLRYALRLRFGGEHLFDQYRTITTNPNGQYISLDGATVRAPIFFVPDEYRVNTSGIGGGLSYPLGKSHILALGMDAVSQKIKGSNVSDRYSAERTEDRPYTIGQASLVGHVGQAVEYGVDGRAWKSSSEESWYFTISAGVGAVPLSGRGKLLEREEKGSALKSRVRVKSGNFEVGGSFWTRASQVDITPPAANDPTSFNLFMNQVYHRANADSLALPDSVVQNRIGNYAFGYAGGVSYRLKRGIVGAEYHWSREQLEQSYGGIGPRALAWDIRSGLEYTCTPVITGRVGYGYRWWDQNDYTRQNEFKGSSTSLGLGLHPLGTSWSLEAAWSFAWNQSDYGDPAESRDTRQMLSTQIYWNF